MSVSTVPRQLSGIDWGGWTPKDRATLTFIVRAGEILLIRKKRGLGAGKVNGPGGRIEAGEETVDCAIREVQEELCVTPTGLSLLGDLRFQFVDGYSIHVFVYHATGCEGEAQETEEAVPLWTPLPAIPYGEMWQDDEIWLPMLLARERFAGRFIFDDDVMLDHAMDPPRH
jgi:8-oxo-dGTP diphosphatase